MLTVRLASDHLNGNCSPLAVAGDVFFFFFFVLSLFPRDVLDEI